MAYRHDTLLQAIKREDLDAVARILATGGYKKRVCQMPTENIDKQRLATETAKMTKKTDANGNEEEPSNWPLAFAAGIGNVECVKALLPYFDPLTSQSMALARAAEYGRAECVRFLIPLSDPKDDDSAALRWAAKRGHAACVRLLMPVSDPKALKSRALLWASKGGHNECIKALVPVSDLDKVIQQLKTKPATETKTRGIALVEANALGMRKSGQKMATRTFSL